MALARESHVPALVLGVLQRRVVVFQNDLGEDAVFASSFLLGRRKRGGGELRYVGRFPGSRKPCLYFQTVKYPLRP